MQHVVIVGGRATGMAAYIQLITRLPLGTRVTIVDPMDADHPAVFGDPHPQLLSNTSAHIGSVIADEPDDFLGFLPVGQSPHAVPRHLVGSYATTRFEQFRGIAQDRGIQTTRLRGLVTAVLRSTNGYVVDIDGAESIAATDIVLAMGPGPARHVSEVASVAPYPTSRLTDKAPEKALVVGMGPSGIDAALVLTAASIPVHMVSRTGCFPAVRSRTPASQPIELAPGARTLSLRETLEARSRERGVAFDFIEPRTGRDAVGQLELDIATASPAVAPWQDSLADVVYLLGSRRVQLTDDPKFVWRYLTSMMRSTATWLHDRISQGLITVGPIEDVEPRAFPLVVSALGFEPYPLFASPDRLVLGRGTSRLSPITSLDDRLRLILPGRTEPERIWAIGPTAGLARLTSSALCVAVAQSREVADQIASIAQRPHATSIAAA